MDIQKITIVGAGIMGTGIAQRCALAGYDVVLYDVDPEAAQHALEQIRIGPWGIDAAVQRGVVEAGTADDAADRVTAEEDLARACMGADLVIEAVYEDLVVKIRLFAELDRAGSDPDSPPPTMSAAYPDAARARRR